jgi:small-conductance mechanosensitive channel
MSSEPTAHLWRAMARGVLQRVNAAEDRLLASIALNQTTMLAAADELQAATTDAAAWLTAHPCPDPNLAAHVALLLDACAEVVLTAQLAGTEPWAETKLSMVRLGRLLGLIDFHSRALDDWQQ